jgi:colanic acid/amylovoran biosynthesis glycosyltransferase
MTTADITICAYDQPHQIGGTTTWLRNLLPRLRNLQIEAKVLLLRHFGEAGATENFLRKMNFNVESCLIPPTTEQRAQWLLDKFRERPTPVFFPNEVLAGYYIIPNLKRAGIKCVGILHSDCDACTAFQDLFVFGDEINRLDAIVCVSESLRSQVTARHIGNCKVEKIPCGVEIPPFVRKRTSNKLRIAYMGRLAEEAKQISRLTRSLCEITRQVPNTEAVLYGDGPARDNVLAILNSNGNREAVSYGGAVSPDQIYQTLREFDVLILLSDYEGLPVCVMEAMACGVVPVCLKTRSGIPELITHNQNGLLVEDCSTNLVNSIRSLQQDLEYWENLSTLARIDAEERWSSTLSGYNWHKLVNSMLHSNTILEERISCQITLPPVHPFLLSSDPRRSDTDVTSKHVPQLARIIRIIRNTFARYISGKTKHMY